MSSTNYPVFSQNPKYGQIKNEMAWWRDEMESYSSTKILHFILKVMMHLFNLMAVHPEIVHQSNIPTMDKSLKDLFC